MKKNLKLALLCFLVSFLLPAVVTAGPGVDESVEPSDTYSLEVNGQEIEIFTDFAVGMPADAGGARVRLLVHPEKHFKYGDIEFAYPRYFTFESDLSEPKVRLWSLSGRQTVIMVQRYPVKLHHKTMAEQLIIGFGGDKSSLGFCELSVNNKTTDGSRVITRIGIGTISQEVYSFDLAEGSLLLIVQDNIVNDRNSDEYKVIRNLLSKTLKFN